MFKNKVFLYTLLLFTVPFIVSATVAQFEEYSNNPVFEISTNGFDSFQITNPQIVLVDDTYYMYYGGADSNAVQVGLATSRDGISWNRYNKNPVLRCSENTAFCVTGGDWSSYRVVPEAIIYEDGIFKLWYLGNNQSSGAISHVGYATSSDGFNWNVYKDNPIFPDVDITAFQVLGVVKLNSKYFLYYRSGDSATSVWVATSDDGVSWSKHTNNIEVPHGIDSVHRFGDKVVARVDSYFGVSTNGFDFSFNESSSGYKDDSQQTAIIFKDDTVHAWYIKQVYTKPYATALFYATATPDVIYGSPNTKPVITLIGNNPVVIEVGGMYVDPGYTASDEEDGDITDDVVVDFGSLNTLVAGEYDVLYSVEDSAGAVATATRKVIVKDDRSSSVAFLHGLPASRLYHKKGEKEKRVWETASTDKLMYIAFNKNGKSEHDDIYTRDILDSFRPITGWWKMADGYEEWIGFMDSLVEDGTIKEWKSIAYDWRLAQDDLITKGKDIGVGNVSYLTEPGSVPYIVSSLKNLAENSPTGKVTIIAHSNGGLVVKNLIKHLEETNDDLLDRIDTVVLVASPQEGTPKSLREVLHGTDTLHKGTVRETVENMPGVYGLLPSSTLMGKLDEPVVEVDKSVKKVGPLNDIAGKKISTYGELRAFLIKDIGVRFKPGPLQTLVPNVLNLALLKSAQNMHDKIDSMDFPDGIRFVQLAGTGLVTARGVHYGTRENRNEKKKNGKYPLVSTVEWLSNTEGDGTVLTASAVSGKSDETYYFDMSSYNDDHKTNYAHATILSAFPVQQFIKKDILNKETEIPLYISTHNTDKVPASRFELRAYSPVDIHLYRYGLHTGVVGDETTELGRYYEEEVPNSYYEEWAEVKYLGAGFIKGDTDIKLDGTGNGEFTLVMDMFAGDTKTVTHTFSNVPVTSESEGEFDFDENEVPVIEYDYDGDGEVDMTIHADGEEQEASFELLKSEIKKLNTKAKRVLLKTANFAEYFANKNREGLAVRTLKFLNKQVTFLSSKKMFKKYRISKDDAKNIKAISNELIKQLKGE